MNALYLGGRLAAGVLLASFGVSAGASPDPIKLPNGVEIRVLAPGRTPAAYPAPTDTVKVHYEGSLENGQVFDSSYTRKEPATFPLSRVIPCWTQGLQQIPVGAKATLRCPPATAYGERGAGGGLIPPGATLTFRVELIDIVGR